MPGQQDHNFQPAVKCPFCYKTNHPQISGWGREGLNVRHKECKYCQKEYSVVILVTSDQSTDIADGKLPGLQRRVINLKMRLREKKSQLSLEEAHLMGELSHLSVLERLNGRQN